MAPIDFDDMLIPDIEEILGGDEDNDDLLFLMLNIAFSSDSVKWGYAADDVEFNVDVVSNPTNEALVADVTNNVNAVTVMSYTHPDQVDVTFPSVPVGSVKLYVQIWEPSDTHLSFRHAALPSNTLSPSSSTPPDYSFDLSSLGPITSESAIRIAVYDEGDFMSGELRFLYS